MTKENLKLVFSNTKTVTIDSDLNTHIPDGYKWARDGYGGNENWFYIIPEGYSEYLDHIDAKPMSLGITSIPVLTLPETVDKDSVDTCKEMLIGNNIMQYGVAIYECICSEHCFFLYQNWSDNENRLYNKINGILFARDRMYQFHIFLNHDRPIADDEAVQREFEQVSRQWMKHVVLSGDQPFMASGDPEEVKATIEDVTRLVGQFKEKMLPILRDDFGDDLKKSYVLIAGMFYLKNGKQIGSSELQSIRDMVGDIDGRKLSKEDMMALLKENDATKSSITEAIRGLVHESIMNQLVMLDKSTVGTMDGGLTMVHFEGVKELLKVLCHENDVDYDTNAFCLECVESVRRLFNDKWNEIDIHSLDESTLVIQQHDNEQSHSSEQTIYHENNDAKAKEAEKKSLKRKISYREREIKTLTSELEQLESVGDKKEDKAKYIEKKLKERYDSFHEDYPVDWSQDPEIEKFVREATAELKRLMEDYKRKTGVILDEMQNVVFISLYGPEMDPYAERLQKIARTFVKDLTRLFNRVESKTNRFAEKGISIYGLRALVKTMEAIYEMGEELTISFYNTEEDVTVAYECMSTDCWVRANSWRSELEYRPEDIEDADRKKEEAASKAVKQKLDRTRAAHEKIKDLLEEEEAESKKRLVELPKLEGELAELVSNYDAEVKKIKDDSDKEMGELQRKLTAIQQKREMGIKEKGELEKALEKTMVLAFSKKKQLKNDIAVAASSIEKLERVEEGLKNKILEEKKRKKKRIKALDKKIDVLKDKVQEVKEEIESSPGRIKDLERNLELRQVELEDAKIEMNDFHVDYLIREHGDLLRGTPEQINNKRKRLEKLKRELAQFREELQSIE